MKLRLASLAETEALGAKLGRALRPGDFIGLSGPLGAGKTALARAVAVGAGVDAQEVTSPTFSLINSYRGGSVPLHHADLYRLETRDELYATGYFDLLEGEGALVVESIDRIPAAAPRDWLSLELSPVSSEEGARLLEVTATGERACALRDALGVSGA